MIPYGRQDVTEDDIAEVVRILRSDWLTQGPAVPQFEAHVARYCGAPHAVALNSATSALHVACLALGLGRGDWLWTVPNTFVASANCGRYCGASVDFVDIDPRTYNLSVAALEAKLAAAARESRLPKVLVPVHFGGQSCDMEAIGALAQRYGFHVIEDASHAVGAKWQGRPVGACTHSDLVVFSFHPVKLITTGEGGVVLTRDPELASRLRRLRSHGITRDQADMQNPDSGPWYYEQIDLGFNYRMTDIQAALGTSQLRRLDHYLTRRRQLVRQYAELFDGAPLVLPWEDPRSESAWHLYVVQLPVSAGANERRKVFEAMREAGIGVNVHYIPVHLHPYYRALGFKAGDFPNAEAYYQRAITLPLFPRLSDADQQRVAQVVSQTVVN
jgi:UDP-4-amino-4,6-dideoxy-N-acetyl-beta-L-altrosamine transaminase